MLARAAQALRSAGSALAHAFGNLSDGIGLEAGRMGRRLGSWIPSRVHVNTLINQSGPNTLARARELFIPGEVFVRLRPRYIADGLSIPLQLELLPSEQLPLWLTMPLSNGNWIRQGIEFDRIGRRVAYHFWRVNPGDITLAPKF